MLRSKFIFSVLAPAFLVTWMATMVHSAVFSDMGYLTLARLEAEVEVLSEEVAVLRERRMAMQKRSDLMSSKSLDPDLIDEKIRSVLGYSREGDFSISRRELVRAIKKLEKNTQ